MSFGNAILVVLSGLYVTGITDTVHGYAEHAAYSLADVAHMGQLESATCTNGLEWYRKGIQLYAYKLHGYKWNKKNISWGIAKESGKLKRETVEEAAKEAFGKWSAVTSLQFTGPVENTGDRQPDIRITFEHSEKKERISATEVPKDKGLLDKYGTDILLNDDQNWTDRNGSGWCDIRVELMIQVGHSLGLDYSDKDSAAMSSDNDVVLRKTEHPLQEDDIAGIQKLYGPPGDPPSTDRNEDASGQETQNAPAPTQTESATSEKEDAPVEKENAPAEKENAPA